MLEAQGRLPIPKFAIYEAGTNLHGNAIRHGICLTLNNLQVNTSIILWMNVQIGSDGVFSVTGGACMRMCSCAWA
jgi:hypothetical protein